MEAHNHEVSFVTTTVSSVVQYYVDLLVFNAPYIFCCYLRHFSCLANAQCDSILHVDVTFDLQEITTPDYPSSYAK